VHPVAKNSTDAAYWHEQAVGEPAHVDALASSLKITPVLARLLCQKGHTEVDSAEEFLNPKLANLQDPFRISHLKAAAERVLRAAAAKENVLIIGDYDVDGVTSSAMMTSLLRALDLNPRYILPRRLEEGYGLTKAVLERALLDKKPSLLIALDCGTTAISEVAWLKSLGIDVLIIDHHRSKETLPDCLLVNPHIHDDPKAPWLNLSTVGLVFKLVHGVIKILRAQNKTHANTMDVRDFLDFVALGTVADLVALREENRILTKHGLLAISKSQRPGVRALCETSGLEAGHPIHPVDIAFKLGPRINASGRLADATEALEMLLTSDWASAQRTADTLSQLNRDRQVIERKVSQEAEERALGSGKTPNGVVLYDPEWHSGVVGIVAGKLSRKFHRPCIVLGREGLFAKGSGRSIPGVSLVAVLTECHDLLEAWGGHPMAVGVSLLPEKLDDFIERFNAVIERHFTSDIAHPRIELAAWLSLNDINDRLLGELEQLRPFGEGNPEPVFGLRDVVFQKPPVFFGENHYRFTLPVKSGTLMGVAWGQGNNKVPVGVSLDLAVKLHWNHWNGRRLMQLELLHWKLRD
jgi:single-stranded-DNA-specific exonuclease